MIFIIIDKSDNCKQETNDGITIVMANLRPDIHYIPTRSHQLTHFMTVIVALNRVDHRYMIIIR